jgi:hypothetical protein
MNELEKLNAICFWLINECVATNAETMTVTQNGVHIKKKQIGDWEIIVRKKAVRERSDSAAK